MSEEVFEIVKTMDRRNIAMQLFLQCAPTIAKLKTSNLLIIPKEDEAVLRQILKRTGLYSYRLGYDKRKVIYLIFNKKELHAYLAMEQNRDFLLSLGYESCELGKVLKMFSSRYANYIEVRDNFPHEMGIILGYPLADVTGFMKMAGKGYKLSGYWKVYDNEADTYELFKRFDQVKDDMILSMTAGEEFADIISEYRNNNVA